MLQPNPNKRNAPQNKPAHREGATKKAKLNRTTSSVARMQSLPPVSLADKALDPEKKPGKGSLTTILSPSGNDSDKENWSPDEDGNPQQSRRRPLPSPKPQAQTLAGKNPRRVGRVLGEQDAVTKRSLFGSRANTAPLSKPRDGAMLIFEDKEDGKTRDGLRGDEAEVRSFMQGEVSPTKRGDMDCVAGLLSLSQGNWR